MFIKIHSSKTLVFIQLKVMDQKTRDKDKVTKDKNRNIEEKKHKEIQTSWREKGLKTHLKNPGNKIEKNKIIYINFNIIIKYTYKIHIVKIVDQDFLN